MAVIGMTHFVALQMCIFAGCDFLKALPGIGMKKAHQHVKRLKTHRKVTPLTLVLCACNALGPCIHSMPDGSIQSPPSSHSLLLLSIVLQLVAPRSAATQCVKLSLSLSAAVDSCLPSS